MNPAAGSNRERDVGGAADDADVFNAEVVDGATAEGDRLEPGSASCSKQRDRMPTEVLFEAGPAGCAHRIRLALPPRYHIPSGERTVAEDIVLPWRAMLRSWRARSGKLHIVFVATVTSP